MARIYGAIAASGLMTFDKSFSRSNGQPLDSTEVFYSLVAAQDYAQTDVAYVGQKIVVVESVDEITTVTHYSIEADGSLKELGAVPVGDGLTVEVADGKIQLAALEGHTSGTYQPYLVDGKIEWREPSATTVEGLDSRLTTAENDIDALTDIVGNAASEGVESSGLVKEVADNATAIEATNAKIGTVAEGKTVVEMISDAQAAATYDDAKIKEDIQANADAIAAIEAGYLKVEDKYDDTVLAARVTTVEGDIATVKGDYLKKTDKEELSGAISAAEDRAVSRVLGYLAEEEVNTSYDTLKEVAAWIESDTTTSAELITRVSDIEKDYLKGSDKTGLQGAIDNLEAFVGALPDGTVSTTVIAYIQEVVDGLNIGDYAKVSELTELAGRVGELEGKAHEHENATVLDAITSAKVAAWDVSEQNAKDYADGLKSSIEDILNGKVNAEEGKSLVADALIAKLEDIDDSAQVNVIDSVDEEQFAIDDSKKLTLLDVAIGKVSGLQGALDDKVDKVEGSRLITSDEVTKLEKLVLSEDGSVEVSGEINASNVKELGSWITTNRDSILGLLSTANATKLDNIADGAQVNVIEAVKVGGTVLDVVNKTVDIPIATADVLGVVKSSVDANKIAVTTDGTMEVNSVHIDKLVQGDDVLVLNGGSAV